MQNLIDLPEFDFGYPLPTQDWFGLWSPLLDCFVLVDDNLGQLRKVQALTVSKLLTVIVRLDENLHKQNIIDNSCASNWTLLDSEAINFTLALKQNFFYDTVKVLQPATTVITEEISGLLTWFLFVLYWVNRLEQQHYNPFVELTSYAFDQIYVDSKQQKIYHVLLLNDAIDQARAQIQEILTCHD